MTISHTPADHWILDTDPHETGMSRWLDAPAVDHRASATPRQAAQACQILTASLRGHDSWSVAFATLAAHGPVPLRPAAAACAADVAHGTPLVVAMLTLPVSLRSWVGLAAASSSPEQVLAAGIAAFTAREQSRSSSRLWAPAAVAAAVTVALLALAVGWIIAPAVAQAPDELLPASVRWAGPVSAVVAAGALAWLGAVLVLLRRNRVQGGASLPAHLLSAVGVDVPWVWRLQLAAQASDQAWPSAAAEQVAQGRSLADALTGTAMESTGQLIAAGAQPEAAFAALAVAMDAQSAERQQRLAPLVLWSAVLAAAVLLSGTVFTVVVPLAELARP